jgi:predicted MFS family arabinose efflux permease
VIGMRLFDKSHVEWPYWAGAAMMGVGLVLVALQRSSQRDGTAASSDGSASADADTSAE